MHLSILALASTQWGVARFTTDSIALISLGILIGLPFLLLKNKLGLRGFYSEGNALSNR